MIGTWNCEERWYRCSAGRGIHRCEWTLKIHSNSCSLSRTARSTTMCSDSEAEEYVKQGWKFLLKLRVLHKQRICLCTVSSDWRVYLILKTWNPWTKSWKLWQQHFDILCLNLTQRKSSVSKNKVGVYWEWTDRQY